MDHSIVNILNEDKPHHPQCTCNFKGVFHKTMHTVFQFDINHESCSRAQRWCKLAKVPANSQEFYENLLRINCDREILSSSSHQIDIDIPRTFTDYPYFSTGAGVVLLKRILYAFIKYNPRLGYLQGMNYIAASLLYHCTESDAFWLFLRLVYDYNLVENYLPLLPGLEKHAHVIEFLMMEHLSELNEHLLKCGVVVQMYITEWCLTLFTSLLNIKYAHAFFSKFFKHQWGFFYKFVLEILDRLKPGLMATSNQVIILDMLKPLKGNSEKGSLAFLKRLETDEKLTWIKFAKICNRRDVNLQVVRCVSANFETNCDFFSIAWDYSD